MKDEFMEKERSMFTVEWMCHLLGVTRSSYYAWLRRRCGGRWLKAGRGTYWNPRIAEALRAASLRCGENRIAKLKATTNSRYRLSVSPSLRNRSFKADRPDKVWMLDIKYIWTEKGWLYIAVVFDFFSRQIVVWAMGDRIVYGSCLKSFQTGHNEA